MQTGSYMQVAIFFVQNVNKCEQKLVTDNDKVLDKNVLCMSKKHATWFKLLMGFDKVVLMSYAL